LSQHLVQVIFRLHAPLTIPQQRLLPNLDILFGLLQVVDHVYPSRDPMASQIDVVPLQIERIGSDFLASLFVQLVFVVIVNFVHVDDNGLWAARKGKTFFQGSKAKLIIEYSLFLRHIGRILLLLLLALRLLQHLFQHFFALLPLFARHLPQIARFLVLDH
jgi:hypothetical protein